MKKKNMILAGILALGLVFTLGLTSCDDEDEYADFYGAWTDGDTTAPFELVIKNSSFKFEYNPGANAGLGRLEFEVEKLKWEKLGNSAVIKGKLKEKATTGTGPNVASSVPALGFVALKTYISALNAGDDVELEMYLDANNNLVFYGSTYKPY